MIINVNTVDKIGFIDEFVDSNLDLVSEISRLKKEKNAIILAHYYQIPEIQEIADFVGDSLALSYKAVDVNADIIVFAGVYLVSKPKKTVQTLT